MQDLIARVTDVLFGPGKTRGASDDTGDGQDGQQGGGRPGGQVVGATPGNNGAKHGARIAGEV